MVKRKANIILVLLFAGCASSPDRYTEAIGLNNNNSALVVIYRTNVVYHSLNPQMPFFYLDGMLVGKLGTGDTISFRVTPGEHFISVKEPIMFMPGGVSGIVKGDFKIGETYFFRYSKEVSDVIVIPIPMGVITHDSTTLQRSTEKGFRERK